MHQPMTRLRLAGVSSAGSGCAIRFTCKQVECAGPHLKTNWMHLVGPDLCIPPAYMRELFGVLLQPRLHRIALTSDVGGLFHSCDPPV